jgi:hypothetical protein
MIEGPFLKAFTPANVLAGFREVGLWPLNRNIITPDKMAPSLATSTTTGFPLPPPPTPVRNLAQSMREAMRTPIPILSLAVDTIIEGLEAISLHSSSSSLPIATFQDEGVIIEPPSQGQVAVESLQSGRYAYLVNITALPLNQPPPTPILAAPGRHTVYPTFQKLPQQSLQAARIDELQGQLQEMQNREKVLISKLEAANTTSVMQHLYLNKLNVDRALNTKSGKSSTLFIDGKGQELTGGAFVTAVHDAEEATKAKAVLDAQVKQSRENTKVQRAGGEAAWKAWKAEYDTEKALWDLRVGKYTPRNIPDHLLAVKPKRVYKKDVIVAWEVANGYAEAQEVVAVPKRVRNRRRNIVESEEEEFEGDATSSEEEEEEEE